MAMGRVKLWHILLHLFSEIPWQALLHNKIIPNLLNLGSDEYIYILESQFLLFALNL